MMGIVYFLYFSQLIFGTFLCGFILIALFPAIVLILVITRKKKIERELLFSDGLAVFIIVYVLFTALSFNKWVLICDEFTHWGMMVKEMLRLDKFYCVPESRLAFHKDYPPFLSVFEYFWVKICGYYSEMGANVALGVFQLSLISAPFLEKKNDFNKKGWVRALIKSFAFLLQKYHCKYFAIFLILLLHL